MASSTATNHPTDDQLLKTVTDQWNRINKALEKFPKFQNKGVPGVSEESIKDLESKLKITLPKEIRAVLKVHNGRKHIGYGLDFRSPTTDLLPLPEWKPYEKDNDQFEENLFECLTDETDACAHKSLLEDAREHLKAYSEGSKTNEQEHKEKKLTQNKKFQSLSSELLIIGQGMDDYAEQYILSVRSGRIYLAVHNIPEWRLIGTFQDWVEKSLSCIEDHKDIMGEQHDEAEVD